ncbi:hypothetical protein C8N25_106221 [Algoriphagus antarcticus]|uniref:Uncharacterized protein n=1 Tax=Algoriphagus antarcticus TaxID=238540 RepID=A0A3E0DXG6_9BACT|nr:hypothetical protein C8N25_106221 [Algoriphagus antarcticus]
MCGMLTELNSKLFLSAILTSMFVFVYLAVKSLKVKKNRILFGFIDIGLIVEHIVGLYFIIFGLMLCPNYP